MDLKKKTGIAIGTAVIGIGAALGVAGLASASNSAATTTTGTTTSQVEVAPGTQAGAAADGTQGQPPQGGMRGGGLAGELATQLGLEESAVQAVLDDVMGANKPAEGAAFDRDAMDAAISKELVSKLGVTADKVQAAFDALHANEPAGGPGGHGAPGDAGTTTSGGTTLNG